MNAQEFVDGIKYPVIFWSGVGPRYEIALLPDAELPFELDEIEGSVDSNGDFRWDGEGEPVDFRGNTIQFLMISDDKEEYERQEKDYNSAL